MQSNKLYNIIVSALFGIFVILAITFMFIKASPFLTYSTLYLVFAVVIIVFDIVLLFNMIKKEKFDNFNIIKLSIVFLVLGVIILAIIWLSYSKIQNMVYPRNVYVLG